MNGPKLWNANYDDSEHCVLYQTVWISTISSSKMLGS